MVNPPLPGRRTRKPRGRIRDIVVITSPQSIIHPLLLSQLLPLTEADRIPRPQRGPRNLSRYISRFRPLVRERRSRSPGELLHHGAEVGRISVEEGGGSAPGGPRTASCGLGDAAAFRTELQRMLRDHFLLLLWWW